MIKNSAYRWKPILDYEQDPVTMNIGEILTITILWNEHREKLSDVDEFDQRIKRK
ncbi:MAG: hypothetical protein OXE59_08480 [Bacteroidetes bacterium]|nr:hypothetical protein [Bacteroidota bacterium]